VAIALWRDGDLRCRRLKALEDENRKLKKLLAETMLDASTLKEMLGKNF
jgi:putative transposase